MGQRGKDTRPRRDERGLRALARVWHLAHLAAAVHATSGGEAPRAGWPDPRRRAQHRQPNEPMSDEVGSVDPGDVRRAGKPDTEGNAVQGFTLPTDQLWT